MERAPTKTEPAYSAEPFGLPLADNSRISSPFGEIRNTEGTSIRHLGIDIAAPKGTPVGAMNAGIVTKTYLDPTYGNVVILASRIEQLNKDYGSQILVSGEVLAGAGEQACAPESLGPVQVKGRAEPIEIFRLA